MNKITDVAINMSAAPDSDEIIIYRGDKLHRYMGNCGRLQRMLKAQGSFAQYDVYLQGDGCAEYWINQERIITL